MSCEWNICIYIRIILIRINWNEGLYSVSGLLSLFRTYWTKNMCGKNMVKILTLLGLCQHFELFDKRKFEFIYSSYLVDHCMDKLSETLYINWSVCVCLCVTLSRYTLYSGSTLCCAAAHNTLWTFTLLSNTFYLQMYFWYFSVM